MNLEKLYFNFSTIVCIAFFHQCLILKSRVNLKLVFLCHMSYVFKSPLFIVKRKVYGKPLLDGDFLRILNLSFRLIAYIHNRMRTWWFQASRQLTMPKIPIEQSGEMLGIKLNLSFIYGEVERVVMFDEMSTKRQLYWQWKMIRLSSKSFKAWWQNKARVWINL